MKRFVKRFALVLLVCALSIGLLEGLLSAFAWFKYGTVDVAELERIQTGNQDAAELTAEGEGPFATYYPHPYLAYVHNEKTENVPGGRPRRLNNVGLLGRDFPLRRDKSKFTVLLVGGSVASQVGTAGTGGRNYLEIALNDRFQFDRPVEVLNGAIGGWKQPQQAITALLYGDAVDAVVSLDGFNEKELLRGQPQRMELPAVTFQELNPVAQRGFGPLAAAWQAQQLKRFALSHQWRTVYFATRAMRSRLEKSAEAPPPGITVRTIFSLPENWSSDERVAFNIDQYKKYIRSIERLGTLHGLKSAYFVQPCPAIDKQLTPEEVQKVGNLAYRDTYSKMGDELLTLQKENLPIVDLRNLFASNTESVYADQIHCVFGARTDYDYAVNFTPSPAYEQMSNTIADNLARLWSIPARDAAPKNTQAEASSTP